MLIGRAIFTGKAPAPQRGINLDHGRTPVWNLPSIKRPESAKLQLNAQPATRSYPPGPVLARDGWRWHFHRQGFPVGQVDAQALKPGGRRLGAGIIDTDIAGK